MPISSFKRSLLPYQCKSCARASWWNGKADKLISGTVVENWSSGQLSEKFMVLLGSLRYVWPTYTDFFSLILGNQVKTSSLNIQTKQKRGEKDTEYVKSRTDTCKNQSSCLLCCTGRSAVQSRRSGCLTKFWVRASYSLSPYPVADVDSAA